tara:strand:- start:33454 stop:34218 length:765 start_codon:yes stop_codon:yes gene_type:complete
MIPLRDDIPSRTFPLINYVVIAICSLAFLFQVSAGKDGNLIVERFGMVPARFSQPDVVPVIRQQVQVQDQFGQVRSAVVEREVAAPTIPIWATVLTCMFLHGGWMHFLGNMWFLYVFGDNVEDRLGHVGFALLYLGTGVLAGVAHFFSAPTSPIPTIGASGAIAGVMGAYAWFYPHAKVQAVLPLFIFIQVFVVPAPLFLGFWFLMQTFSGLSSGATTGVAWWAHIGGFVAGAAVALVAGRTHFGHDAVSERRF